ncbi:MAG: hypothetical protein O2973_06115 [Gemmatimonadetes bacterium]|nr:hypothetical protein [Gemmatimonadota bacterium]
MISWGTVIHPATPGRAAITMRQSTLGGLLLTPRDLAHRQAGYRPDPERLAIIREIVNLADGARSLADIAREMAGLHPGLFANDAAALAWVTRRFAEISDAADV